MITPFVIKVRVGCFSGNSGTTQGRKPQPTFPPPYIW